MPWEKRLGQEDALSAITDDSDSRQWRGRQINPTLETTQSIVTRRQRTTYTDKVTLLPLRRRRKQYNHYHNRYTFISSSMLYRTYMDCGWGSFTCSFQSGLIPVVNHVKRWWKFRPVNRGRHFYCHLNRHRDRGSDHNSISFSAPLGCTDSNIAQVHWFYGAFVQYNWYARWARLSAGQSAWTGAFCWTFEWLWTFWRRFITTQVGGNWCLWTSAVSWVELVFLQ